MPDQDNRAYFAQRAHAERELSSATSDPVVARIHAQLAERYEKLVGGLNEPRPRLIIAAGD